MNFYVSVTTFILLVLSIGLHEAAHARVASYFGDTTPDAFGVNTWNPIPHIRANFISCVFVPAVFWFWMNIFIGGAMVRLDPDLMRRNRVAAFCATAAGPGMNLALALAFGGISVVIAYLHHAVPGIDDHFGFPVTDDPLLQVFMMASTFNFLLMVFNLIPIPPLDGSSMAMALFPGLRPLYESIGSFGFLVLILLVNFTSAGEWLFKPNVVFAELLQLVMAHVVTLNPGA